MRLYFVPVLPYGTDDYLVCPVCSRGLQVKGEQVPVVRSMAKATASRRAGRLTEAAYGDRVEQFWRRLGGNPARQQPPAPAGPGGSAPAQPATPATPATVAPPTAAAGDAPPWLSQLRELAQLHDQGVLSDDQYEAAKRRAIQQE